MEELASEVLRQCSVNAQTIVVYGPIQTQMWPHTHDQVHQFMRHRMRILAPTPYYVIEKAIWTGEMDDDTHPPESEWTPLITLTDATVALELLSGRRLRVYCNDKFVIHTSDKVLILRILETLA